MNISTTSDRCCYYSLTIQFHSPRYPAFILSYHLLLLLLLLPLLLLFFIIAFVMSKTAKPKSKSKKSKTSSSLPPPPDRFDALSLYELQMNSLNPRLKSTNYVVNVTIINSKKMKFNNTITSHMKK